MRAPRDLTPSYFSTVPCSPSPDTISIVSAVLMISFTQSTSFQCFSSATRTIFDWLLRVSCASSRRRSYCCDSNRMWVEVYSSMALAPFFFFRFQSNYFQPTKFASWVSFLFYTHYLIFAKNKPFIFVVVVCHFKKRESFAFFDFIYYAKGLIDSEFLCCVVGFGEGICCKFNSVVKRNFKIHVHVNSSIQWLKILNRILLGIFCDERHF